MSKTLFLSAIRPHQGSRAVGFPARHASLARLAFFAAAASFVSASHALPRLAPPTPPAPATPPALDGATRGARGGTPVPCGWLVVEPGVSSGLLPPVSAPALPSPGSRPRRITPAPAATACAPPASRLVHCFTPLEMQGGRDGSRLSLHVTALEDGWAGKIIRCRSLLNGVVLMGRVIDQNTVELVRPAGEGGAW